MNAPIHTTAPRALRASRHQLGLCGWCLLVLVVEVGLYRSYEGHDARFHWFTHFFVGAGVALLAMSVFAWRARRPVRLPLVWLVVAHLYAMFPDVLFSAFGIAHRRWMDIFAGHISSHFVPGRNTTWYAFFVACLAAYLVVLDRVRQHMMSANQDHANMEH